MKVTTDACVFGAMTDVEPAGKILDIGAGTGLLALMAAQRSKADIVAVEMDLAAAEQAKANFSESPWGKRLFLYQETIQEFAQQAKHQHKYDHIISNPPFFLNSQKSLCPRRAAARHLGSLPLSELMDCVDRLLTTGGHFQVLLPLPESRMLRELAEKSHFFCASEIRLHPLPEQSAHRLIMTLKRRLGTMKATIPTDFSIRATANTYSSDFDQLLQNYYLRYAKEKAL